ncbi:MAG: C-GCAxxG-C-C family (seleno)protein [Bacillota bacterium]
MEAQNLKTYIKKGSKEELDLNCAEAMLYGANEVYNLEVAEDDLKLAAGFGGGMAIKSVCGALTGAIMILSKAFVANKAHDSQIYDLTSSFLEKYRAEMGYIDCASLKNKYASEETGCEEIILQAAEIIDSVMEDEDYLT